MPVPEQFTVWNAQAVAEAKALLQKGEALAARTAQLGKGPWAIFFSPAQRTERHRVLKLAAELREGVRWIDHEIVDYWRIQARYEPGPRSRLVSDQNVHLRDHPRHRAALCERSELDGSRQPDAGGCRRDVVRFVCDFDRVPGGSARGRRPPGARAQG